ncbi:MAG: Tad domain-containing protein [Planctomycetales bacterium]|nr:Tad domain-containing protein [Planctomycetales bacterium]MBN8623858.1 Tad domain-containing protein [Planctomycetota bacterium]
MQDRRHSSTPAAVRQRAARRSSVGRAGRRVEHRRGLATGLLILTLVFLSGLVALGINTARLCTVRAELQAACEASALAGAAELMDENLLFGQADSRDDVLMAREMARLTGLRNQVDGREFRLDPNHDNAPTGDVVVGTLDPLAPAGTVLGIPTNPAAPGDVNTVRVSGRVSRNIYNTVSLAIGGLTGVTTADPAVAVQATLDQRVVGFRPERGVKAPILPLVAEYESWIKQSTAEVVAGKNDNYGVNPVTGEVTFGPDGIPELVFVSGAPKADAKAAAEVGENGAPGTAEENKDAQDGAAAEESQPATPGWCYVPQLTNELNIDYVWPVRVREGLSRGDLAPYGGELVVVGTLPMPALPQMPAEMGYTLMEILGQTRVWPLADAAATDGEATDGEATVCDVVGFAAGRIVRVGRGSGESNDTWEIVVQPTTMVSSQAVTAAGAPRNPWIGKLELTQ